jgi:hypothetical protein
MAKTDTAQAIIDPGLDRETVIRLAALSPIEYDRARETEAEALGVRVGTLDSEVGAFRKSEVENGPDQLCAQIEPWPDPVDGAVLLDTLRDSVSSYLFLPSGAAEMIALWVLHAHAVEAFYFTPRLSVRSPVKRCGKTALLDWLEAVTPKGIRTENLTTAVLFRVVDEFQPTMLVDETDRYLREDNDLICAINAGHRKGGRHMRCEGDNNKVRAFKTFAPVALAGIGTLPDVIADRSLEIMMKRVTKIQMDRLKPFRADRAHRERELARKAARWAVDNLTALAAHEPEMLDGFHSRLADNLRPIFACADIAGGDWPRIARDVARNLVGEDQDRRTLLLADIREIFDGRDRATSAELANSLGAREDRPWCEWRNGKPITPRQIAKLLEPFGIAPGTIRTAAGTAKGYLAEAFKEAFALYTPPQSVTPSQAPESGAYSDFQSVTRNSDVTDRNCPKPKETAGCDVVTDEIPPTPGEDAEAAEIDRQEREAIRWEAEGGAR